MSAHYAMLIIVIYRNVLITLVKTNKLQAAEQPYRDPAPQVAVAVVLDNLFEGDAYPRYWF